jgi:hypothetical protein
MLIKAIGGDITFPQLLWQIFSSMQDPFAIASFILLLVFAIVFGHIVWGIEREANGPFHPRYGPGFIDGLWVRDTLQTRVPVTARISDFWARAWNMLFGLLHQLSSQLFARTTFAELTL